MRFEENKGQLDSRVNFSAHGLGYQVFLTPTEPVLALFRPDVQRNPADPEQVVGDAVRVQLVNSNASARAEGQELLETTSNYFRGREASGWKTNLANYNNVLYRSVYEGTDLKYYGTSQRQLEFDFIVKPGANASQIRLNIAGAESIRFDQAGNLVIATAAGEIVQNAPVLYQEINGVRQSVTGSYRSLGGTQVGFTVGEYDATRELVIDPSLNYSSYLGGSGADAALDAAVDDGGSLYIAGTTESTDFPTVNAIRSSAVNYDAFVSKLSPTGTSLLYSTYFGGTDGTTAQDVSSIVVDKAGNAFITGSTSATDLATTTGAYTTTHSSNTDIDAFVAKIGPAGHALVYATYLGGSNGADYGQAIAIDSSGNAHVAGKTTSTNFPTSSAAQGNNGGGTDAFVTKLNSAGSALTFSTYLGGSGTDEATGMSLDSSGNVFVVGSTGSSGFATGGAYDTSLGGSKDAFAAKYSSSGSLNAATYLGGASDDAAEDAVVDSSGNLWLTGWTQSSAFPTSGSAYDASLGGSQDAFLTKFTALTSAPAVATFLGGSGSETGYGIAIDGQGRVSVAGVTDSSAFPTQNPTQSSIGGSTDAFITRFASSGNSLDFSTFMGGSSNDEAAAVAVDRRGELYVAGKTASSGFTTLRCQQGTAPGSGDAFLAKVITPPPAFVPDARGLLTYANGSAPLSPTAYSGHGLRYGDGTLVFTQQDLSSSGFSIPLGTTRSWSNGPGYAAASPGGPGWVIGELRLSTFPKLLPL